jgi:hypothetical protein
VGVGVRNGAEAILHSLDRLLARGWDPGEFLFKIDLTNAFNLVSRSAIFEEVRSHIPGLARWVEFCYCNGPPFLFAGGALLYI